MEALILRQQITERVFTASLQVDGFLSEIDSETGQIRAVHDDLTDRQTAKVASSTLGSAIGTGGGAVGSTLALGSTAAATAGNWFGATFGTLGAVFGFVGYFQGGHSPKACFPSLGQKPNQCTVPPPVDQCDPKNKTPPANGCSPVMLYHLVFPEAKANADVGFHSDYDLPIENYLRDKRRRETLINPWIIEAKNLAEKKKKKKPEDPTDSNNVLKSAEPFLFASNKKPLKVSIDDLTNRANKLGDLRAVVARMNRDLSRLMEDLATGLQCTPRDGPNTQ